MKRSDFQHSAPHIPRLRRPAVAAAMFLALALPVACSSSDIEEISMQTREPTDLWPLMVGTESTEFLSLLELVGLRTLVENNKGSITVFMPLDDAFDAIPEGMLARLKTPEYRPMLTLLLEHHIALGIITPEAIVSGNSTPTIGGTTLSFGAKLADDNEVVGDSAAIVDSGFLVRNGQLVTIDSLVLPPLQDVLDHYKSDADTFVIFGQILAASGWQPDDQPLELFAPNDAAFANIPGETLDAIVTDRARARAFVDAHRVRGSSEFTDLPDALTTASGANAVLQRGPSGATISVGSRSARVKLTDLPTHSGYMHIVDAVLAL